MADTTHPVSDSISAIGSTRRLRALTAAGWDLQHLASATGLNTTVALNLLWAPPTAVPTRLHDAISKQYRQLITQKAPDSPESTTAAATALAAGWAAPGEWDNIDTDKRPSRNRPDQRGPKSDKSPESPFSASERRLLEAEVTELKHTLEQQLEIQARMAAEQRRTDRALADITEAHDRAATANTTVLQERLEFQDLAIKLRNANDALAAVNAGQADDLATKDVEIAHLRSQLTALNETPGQAPRVGELTVEQDPDGSTRISLFSRKKARVTFGGVEVDVPAMTGRSA